MKNFFYLLLCAIMLTGCGDDETEPTPQITLTEVVFNDATITRATDGAWQGGDRIGVYMVAGGSTQINTNTIINNADNIPYTVSSAGLKGQFKPSNADKIIFYPIKNAVDFYAYYPYSATTNTFVEVNTNNQKDLTGIDLMTATAKSMTQKKGAVKLEFKHRLAKITINVAGENPTTQITGIGASLVGLGATAKYDIVNNTFKELGQNATIPLFGTSDFKKFEAIVIPQAINENTKIMMLANAVITECSINNITKLEAGKDYQFDIVYVNEQFTIISLKIVDWFANDPLTKTYKLGDYYPDPDVKFNADKTVKSGTAPIGMVFWLDTRHSSYKTTDGVVSGQKGMIVDMIEAPTPLAWSTETILTKALYGILGVQNTSILAGLDSYSRDTYPAIGWTMERRQANKTQGMEWCLPADIQLRILTAGSYNLNWQAGTKAADGEIIDWGVGVNMPNYESRETHQENFNKKLVAAGGMEIKNSYYWASTEENNTPNKSWFCNLKIGYDFVTLKYFDFDVRCVAAF